MARIGRYKISMRRKINFGLVIGGLVQLFITAYLGDQIIGALKTSLFGSCTPTTCIFYTLYDLAGLLTSQTSTLIGIFGIIGFAAILMGFIRVSRIG